MSPTRLLQLAPPFESARNQPSCPGDRQGSAHPAAEARRKPCDLRSRPCQPPPSVLEGDKPCIAGSPALRLDRIPSRYPDIPALRSALDGDRSQVSWYSPQALRSPGPSFASTSRPCLETLERPQTKPRLPTHHRSAHQLPSPGHSSQNAVSKP